MFPVPFKNMGRVFVLRVEFGDHVNYKYLLCKYNFILIMLR
jgi:hypothetical protein